MVHVLQLRQRDALRAAIRATESAPRQRLGLAPLLLRRRAEERRRVLADAVLEPVVLRRQRDVADPADGATQPGVSTRGDRAAATRHEDQHRAALLDWLHR